MFTRAVIWRKELVPRRWREGLTVNIIKKGDKEEQRYYITECSG